MYKSNCEGFTNVGIVTEEPNIVTSLDVNTLPYDTGHRYNGRDWMPGDARDPIYTEKTLRLGFIRKVFGIFTLQILITVGIVAITTLTDSVRLHVASNVAIYIVVPLIPAFIILIIMLVQTDIARNFPVNFVLLGIFTFLFGLSVAAGSTLTERNHVLYTVGMLLCPCLLVTLYTYQNKFDLKWYLHLLIVVVTVAIVTGVTYVIFPSEDLDLLIIPAVGSLIISIYLTIFVHCLISEVCCEFRMENYVLNALSAYLVVISVFIIALLILAAAKGDGCDGDCCSGGSGGGSQVHFCCLYGCYGCSTPQRTREEDEEER